MGDWGEERWDPITPHRTLPVSATSVPAVNAMPHKISLFGSRVEGHSTHGGHAQLRVATGVHLHHIRAAVDAVSHDNIAVAAGGKASLQLRVPRVGRVSVERNEGRAAREGDVVPAVRGPVGHAAGAGGVAPGHHVGDGAPAMLAHPVAPIHAVVATVHAHRGRPLVVVAEVIRGHNSDRRVEVGVD